MAISSLSGIDFDSAFQTPSISSSLIQDREKDSLLINSEEDQSGFRSAFNSAVRLINETNAYSNAAEEEEIKYAMGETDNLHEVQIAQQKANVSLQYTVAVRDAFMSGYKELMNLQF